MEPDTKPWQVTFSSKAERQTRKLPGNIKAALNLLRRELEEEGPERLNWPHYGKIKGKSKKIDMHHCHLNNNRPIYVAVWLVQNFTAQIMEVRYVGTHENADYRRIS